MNAISQIWALSPQLRIPLVAWIVIVTGVGLWFMWRGWRGDRQRLARRCPICQSPIVEGLTCAACRFEARRERSLHYVRRNWSLIAGGFVIANFGMPIPAIELYSLMGYIELYGLGALGLAVPLVIAGLVIWVGGRPGGCRCPRCRYDMSRAAGLRCSECGYEASSRQSLYAPRRRSWALVVSVLLIVVAFALTQGAERVAPLIAAGFLLAAIRPLRQHRVWTRAWRVGATFVVVGLATHWSVFSTRVYEEGSALPAVPTTVLILGMWHLPEDWIWHHDSSLSDRLDGRMWTWQRELVRARSHAALRRVDSLRVGTRAHRMLRKFENDDFWAGPTPAGFGLVSFAARELAEAPSQEIMQLAAFSPFEYHPEAVEPHVNGLIENVLAGDIFTHWSAILLSMHPETLESTAPAIVDRLAQEHDEEALRRWRLTIRLILEDCTDETREVFLSALESVPEPSREILVASFAADSSGSPRVTAALLRLLRVQDPQAGHAAVSLAARGEAIDELIPLAFAGLESDAPGRALFARALGATGESLRPHAVRFADAVHDDDLDVVLAVVVWMEYLHEEHGFPLEPWLGALHAAARNEQLQREWGVFWVNEALKELAD